jgi:hypothetical protein
VSPGKKGTSRLDTNLLAEEEGFQRPSSRHHNHASAFGRGKRSRDSSASGAARVLAKVSTIVPVSGNVCG